MKIFFKHIRSHLKPFYSENEVRDFSYLIVEKITGLSFSEMVLNKNIIFSPNQRNIADAFVDKLKNKFPIQYLLGETDFYGLRFYVDENVLIPRPETEELVEWIASDYHPAAAFNFLDIGVGSGAIAVTLKHLFRNAAVDAFDISEPAIGVAKQNAKRNKTAISFHRIDILQAPLIDKKWDIIVSNPPYIRDSEKRDMDTTVLDYEPHIALFVPDGDDLLFYRQIALFARSHLNEKGCVYFEIHRDAGERVVKLLQSLHFRQVELRKDMSGNDRMIKAQRFH
ncbi:MAG: peptide chain release factor N(5)-glutamine methyltransferase [Prevotellaceae bacterium]|jgi:release factor glutamine methyltransferase|nr:peptide chain release factor N(5)-glutamine methyltransferase [Prevotellaceae bacterium]